VQTPQAFAFDLISAAHRARCRRGLEKILRRCRRSPNGPATASACSRASRQRQAHQPTDDFARAEISRAAALADLRTGNGFDVHAFADGDHVMPPGIRIPHSAAA